MVVWLALVGVLLCSSAPVVAQTGTARTIRVETKEVLVPVVVVDKQRLEDLQHMKRSIFWQRVNRGDFHFLESLTIRGLSANEFTVVQDGEKQKIESVTPEEQKQSPIITDNLGNYREFVGVGGGSWAIPLWEDSSAGKNIFEPPALPGYDVAYTPSSYSDGACYKIKVTVDRPDVLVFSRNEYCNASRNGADPLRGTTLGKQIESDLQKNRSNALMFDVAAIPLIASDGAARMRIVLNYASDTIIEHCGSAPQSIAIVGTFVGSNARYILSFSDEAVRAGDLYLTVVAPVIRKLMRFGNGRCLFLAPFRYETEVEIPPGEYRLQIGFMDGKKFGRGEVLLTVPNYSRKQLSISGIALARRFRDLRTEPPESPSTVAPRGFHEIPMKPTDSPIALPQNYGRLVSDGAEIAPTANTRFLRSDPFCYFFQIYEPPTSTSQPQQPKVEAQLRIVDATTGHVARQVKPIDAARDAQLGDPLIPIGGRLDITNLPPGAYELQAKATDSTGASTDWRSVAFSVE
jgi:hypothetical protein